MRYVSLDIETTGLRVERDQVLSVAMVLDDLLAPVPLPVTALPHLHVYVRHPEVRGQSYALSMNADILWSVAEGTVPEHVHGIVDAKDLPVTLWNTLMKWGLTRQGGVTVAGKNVLGFDVPFLDAAARASGLLFKGQARMPFHRRVLDPAVLYYEPGDLVLPSLSVCLDRAGLDSYVDHDALGDARDVVGLIRNKLRRTPHV